MNLQANQLAATEPVRRAVRDLAAQPSGGPAWSLFLDKLSFARDGGPEAKADALRDTRDFYRKAHPHLAAACAAKLRWLDALENQLGPERIRRLTLVNDSRLLLHLGRASVLENVGLYAERTTGLPLIPGTALKGVLSTWACWEANESGLAQNPPSLDPQRREIAQRIFGDNSQDGSEHAGDIVFLGGFPTQPPTMGLDIVNPHHDARGNPATDLHPNVFLGLEPGTVWHIAFHGRAGLDPVVARELLDTTGRWLRDAFAQHGVGAKTSSGFGRLHDPSAPNPKPQAGSLAQAIARERVPRDASAPGLGADYPNDATFKNRVLDLLTPGNLQRLEKEIPILSKLENAARAEQLRALLGTRDMKDIRKRLADKPWFKKEWLPLP